MLSQRGSHILEFSLVVFFLFFFIAGAFDINTALQSYTALQEGVKKSLRCSYATDSECVNPTLGTREPRYNVVRYPNPVNDYYVNNFDYSGDANWGVMPEESHTPQVVTADTISFSYDSIKQPDSLVSRVGPIHYLYQSAVLPWVSGEELNPTFGDHPVYLHLKLNPNKDIKNEKKVDISGSVTSTNLTEIGTTDEFRIEKPFNDNEVCLGYNANGPDLNKITKCPEQAKIMIHVRGASSGSGKGKVYMSILRDGIAESLGARDINGDPNFDNFAVRGVRCKDGKCDYDATNKNYDRGYVEPTKYANKDVEYGQKLRLKFYLQSEAGEQVTWAIQDIRIFTSLYEPKQGTLKCIGLVPSEQSKTAPCPTQFENFSIDPAITEVKQTTLNDMVMDPYSNKSGLIACDSNYGIGGASPGESSTCPSECAKKMEGVRDPYDIKCNYSAKDLTEFKIDFKPTCDRPAPTENDFNPEVKKYLTKTILKQKTGEYTVCPESDPAKYECAAFPPTTRRIDDSHSGRAEDSLPNNSLFAGIKPDLGCGWEETLHQAAIKDLPDRMKIPPQACFKGTRKVMNEVQVATKPTDQCIAYRQSLKGTGEAENLGALPYSALPADCLNNQSLCKLAFLGYTAGTASTVDVNAYTAIAQHGIPVIQSSFPRATFNENCSDDYCTEIKAIPTGDDNVVSYAAKMKVPLTLLKIAGMDNVDISYQDSHRLEKVHSK